MLYFLLDKVDKANARMHVQWATLINYTATNDKRSGCKFASMGIVIANAHYITYTRSFQNRYNEDSVGGPSYI
jgi:hypothetical protein